jgi:Domain of unknown function (DUF1835)
VLHVTNGDSTVATMERARLGGDMLSWHDVLHEGPVPPLPPAELRRVRAEHLATLAPMDADAIEAQLRERDERLAVALADGEPVVLWFEHDLFDQLQLIEILAGLPDRPEHVELICIGTFPGRPGFAGLGELEPGELASLWPVRTAVTPEHVRAARAAWDVFRGDDPRALARAAAGTDERLPYLAPALQRLLEELPGARDGLARTERQLLRAVADGARTREDAFVKSIRAEEAPFLGDGIAFDRLDELGPLVGGNGSLALTDAGRAVLEGRADRVALLGFDRWLGGLHVRADGNLWRWDGERAALIGP